MRSGCSSETKHGIFACASDQFDSLQYFGKHGTVAKAAVDGEQKDLERGSCGIQSLAQLLHHSHKLARQVVLPNGLSILLPFLSRSVATTALDSWGFLEAAGQGARANFSLLVQRHQQRSLQETQPKHQVDMKRRGEWITLVEGLCDQSPGLAQSCVVCGDADVTARAPGSARSRMGVNNRCGSQRQREWRKYSAPQLRFCPPLVQMTRDRVRRPRQTRTPSACRTARLKERC